MMKPQRLKKGDTIGVISPASSPNQENLTRAIEKLQNMYGVKVKLGKSALNTYGYLAGSDLERLEDLHDMFEDKEVKGIICACGGYGTGRIASILNYELIKENPKVFWGYSDITFLHTSIRQITGLTTFHGPMLGSDLGEEDAHEDSWKSLQQLFEPAAFTYTEELSPLETLHGGKGEGILTGGNLCLMVSTLGTAFEINTKDKIILIEDIHEEPRSVDRMLNQLYMTGKLQEASGLVFGDFKDCGPGDRKLSLELDEVLDHYARLAKVPAVKGFQIGHCNPHYAVPLGVKATLDASNKILAVDSGIE
ncbi:S66 peptidase family protein [Falsibacillus pallidus]|uniref:S66 peptidase family protein n=1 Tax=Falsibacillus pallidus TaxID=493781 RepID=UPI003D96DAC2